MMNCVYGLSALKRLNHIIAIGPGVVAVLVGFLAVAFGEPHDIQPMPAPTLAIVGRREQAIDQPLVSIRRAIGDELPNLFRRRGQAENVQRGSANERRAVGFGRRLQPGGLEFR